MNAPVDQAARDRVVGAIGETLFVDAGAGSGKTTQLVGRVVELVRHGVPMGHIAAITFTEAAAAELRERVRAKLEQAAADATGPDAVLLATAVDEVDQAALQTLHSFAQSILRRFPIEAGLPPAIDIADEISSALAFEDRFDAFSRALFADEAWRPLLRRFLLLGCTTEHLRDVAHILNDNYDRLDASVIEPVRPPDLAEVDLSKMIAALEAALALRSRCIDDEDRLAQHLDGRVVTELELLRGVSGDRGLEALRAWKNWSFRDGRGPNWDGCKPEVAAALRAADDARTAEVESHLAAVLGAIAARVQAFVLSAAADRRAGGQLEFHDLLVLSRDVLRAHPDVRRRLAESHRYLLVDEFQDTDPLQLEIASLIAAGGDAIGPWDELDVAPGRIFFVGDPKQSIYRFRRADVGLYVDVREHYRKGLCELSANFRTVPGLIGWVNEVFTTLMAPDEGRQPGYVPLEAVREPLSDGRAPVTVLGGPLELMADAVRRQSGEELAELLATMVQEQWPIAEDGAERPVGYGDMVVLVPSRLAVPALEDAFSLAGVPYRLETASLIWSSQEIREVLSVMHAVSDPGDEVNLVAALRSPMFGCGDDDLAAWRRARGRWTYLFDSATDLGDHHPVARGLAALRALHEQRWWLGPEGLIEALATSFGTFQFAVSAGGRRDRWRRLRFLADQAQSFVESRRGDLTDFLRWAELQQSEIVRISSPVLPEADLEAVRVMTIHASKGLEFPVVAMFGLGSARKAGSPVSVLWGEHGAEVKLGSEGTTIDYESLAPADEQMEQAERVRLLYVAATRAKDRLIVCNHYKAAKKAPAPGREPLGQLLADHQPEDRPDLSAPWEPAGLAAVTSPDQVPEVRSPDDPLVVRAAVERAGFEVTRAALLADERAVWSATAVAKAAAGPELEPFVIETDTDPDAQSDDQRVWRRGRAGTAIGRAVHGTLQLVDLQTLDRLDGIARSQAEAEGVDSSLATVAGMARAGANAPVVRDLISRQHWREMYVAAPVGGVMVEGYVDLLADDGAGGLVVLDYKTDSVTSDEQVAERTSRYRLQAATYALALEEVTGRPVTRAAFLFLSKGQAREADVEDLDGAKAEVRAVLAKV